MFEDNPNEKYLIITSIIGFIILVLGFNIQISGYITLSYITMSIGAILTAIYPTFLFIYFERNKR